MPATVPKVSVIIATYATGPSLHSVMESLDAQTMPPDELEVVFVDDGSPDDTFASLQALAATRPNVQVHQIEHSGWPGRPRNVGIEVARGEYVFFMDHDDFAFPDAMRRMHAFATAGDLDVVHAKEVVDGWSTPGWVEWRRQIPRGYDRHSFDVITPHKLYRRQFLVEEGIRFPEGRVRLEDLNFNVKVWARTDAIGIMADYPVYKWILHEDNSHKRLSPTYWDDLEESLRPLVAMDRCDKQEWILARTYRRQLLDRLGPGLATAPESVRQDRMTNITARLDDFPRRIDRLLTPAYRARSALLRRQDLDGLVALGEADRGYSLKTSDLDLAWDDGSLHVTVSGTIADASGAPLRLRATPDGFERALPEDLAQRFEPGELSWTDALASATAELLIRSTRDRVDWVLESEGSDVLAVPDGSGGASVQFRTTARLDPRTGAFGRPLEQDTYEVFLRLDDFGLVGRNRVRAPGGLGLPAAIDASPALAFSTPSGFLQVGLEGNRAVALASRPLQGSIRATGSTTQLTIPLDMPAWGSGTRSGALLLALHGLRPERWEARVDVLDGRATLVAEGPTPPTGIHALQADFGGPESPAFAWIVRLSRVGRTPTLELADRALAGRRAADAARESRLPAAAKVKRRLRRILP